MYSFIHVMEDYVMVTLLGDSVDAAMRICTAQADSTITHFLIKKICVYI